MGRLAQTLDLAGAAFPPYTSKSNTTPKIMKFEDDLFLHVCESIERELVQEYISNPRLTDVRCLYALDRSKIVVKQAFGYGANESAKVDSDLIGIPDRCVSVAKQYVNSPGGPTLKEFLARIDKIGRSVRRHSQDGTRGYFDFIQNFVK